MHIIRVSSLITNQLQNLIRSYIHNSQPSESTVDKIDEDSLHRRKFRKLERFTNITRNRCYIKEIKEIKSSRKAPSQKETKLITEDRNRNQQSYC